MGEKFRQTLILQALVTVAALGLDYLFNAVLFPTPGYTPVSTLAIALLVGTPFTYYNVSLRIDAQRARRDLVASEADRDDALHRLEHALEDAEAASRAKSEFVATLSHEIRTPLNGVLGMAQAMAAAPLDRAQRERLEVIRSCGEAVLVQLNDVLDLSKIEAGKLELEEIDFDLALVIDGAAGAFGALSKAKGLAFTVDISGARGTYVGDPNRLRQVLYNLISNALKFTEKGGITLEAHRVGPRLRLAVTDTGIGMSEQVLQGLFQKFSQGEKSTTRRFGGTGLGLAICRELVEMMGGQIRVDSVEGKGSTFSFEVPLRRIETIMIPGRPRTAPPQAMPEPAPVAQAPTPADPALARLRVLAVDDNPVNRLVIQTLLSQAGMEPVLVGDGRAAIDAWKVGGFDLILMDARMPVMDGLEAARAIRAIEAQTGALRTPIIALTADVMHDQIAAFTAAGMDAHVAKPIEAQRLFEAIERALASTLPAATQKVA